MNDKQATVCCSSFTGQVRVNEHFFAIIIQTAVLRSNGIHVPPSRI